ncbi:MAG: 30S ribosomal protein S17 [Spirochaetota bacterium]|nr:30S ribosomal protein S17 [Spirochaetota bacterium]
MEKKVSKKTLVGRVISDKMDKTIVVLVERKIQHPIYKKYVRVSKKFKAHDEKNLANEGDEVKIISCRPLSKDKSFRLLEIIKKSKELLG